MEGSQRGSQPGPGAERMLSELMPLRLAHKAVQLQWRLVFLPWTLFLMGVSAWASLLIRFLVTAGVPPADYADKSKVRELASVIEHMHQREDAYRRKLKEVQEEGENRLKDKKKAIIKLQKARVQLTSLQERVGEEVGGPGSPHASEGDTQIPRQGPRPLLRPQHRLPVAGIHVSLVLASAAALWLFRQDGIPVISRKTASSIIFPTWVAWGWVLFLRAPPAFALCLFCAAWFLLGFVASQWMASYTF